MSEFKFACPVCNQHITADSGASGTQIECPTCFRRIIVPQAPAGPRDPKLILSAAEPAKPRPASARGAAAPESAAGRHLPSAARIALAVGLCAAALAFWAFGGKPWILESGGLFEPAPAAPGGSCAPAMVYPIPTGFHWTLDLSRTAFPKGTAAGRIEGRGFRCERSTVRGGHLQLLEGPRREPDLGISLHLAVSRAEELSGKILEVRPNTPPPVPRVIWRWKDERGLLARSDLRGGYALKLAFDKAANGHLAGRIYLCLPDDRQSFVAGSFDARIKDHAASDKQHGAE